MAATEIDWGSRHVRERKGGPARRCADFYCSEGVGDAERRQGRPKLLRRQGINMAFEARQSTVGKLLNDSIYRIPRNQRAYVWDEHNWKDLFEDIKLVTEEVATSHFIGSIVLMEEEEEDSLGVFTIIDGQQRVITLTLLLSSLMFAFKKRNMINHANGTKNI